MISCMAINRYVDLETYLHLLLTVHDPLTFDMQRVACFYIFYDMT